MVFTHSCLLFLIADVSRLGTACEEGDFTDFISGNVALLNYSSTECSLYDKVCVVATREMVYCTHYRQVMQ